MKHFFNNSEDYRSRYPDIEIEVAGSQQHFQAADTEPSLGSTTYRLLSDWVYYVVVGLFSMVNNVFEMVVTLLRQMKLLPYFRFLLLILFLYVAFYQQQDHAIVTHSTQLLTSNHNIDPNAAAGIGLLSEDKINVKRQDPFALAYIDRFSKVAQTEMKKFGIPASIKLAQGLLESNNGKSRLAAENFNHFGLKCFSKSCANDHCSNHMDDSHKDFFRKYKSAWESWRDHSQFLTGERYAHLQDYDMDYKKWAKGLKKAGYATDRKYDSKLIAIIELYNLDRFD